MQGLSTSRRCTRSAECFRQQGIDFVIRYYSERTRLPEKVLTPGEAQALNAAGLKLAVVYQDRARKPADFSKTLGKRNGAFAGQYAREVGQPEGSAIFFAVDYDAGPGDLNKIIAYFKGVKEALTNHPAGVYGSGYICKKLRKEGLVSHTWLAASTGWRGSADYTNWNVKQALTDQPLCALPAQGWEACDTQGQDTSWCFDLGAPPAVEQPDIDALPVLRKGDKGKHVKRLQRLLNRWLAGEGSLLLLEDGDFGKKTRRAVRAFQASNVDDFGRPMEVDGLVGGLTWGALFRIAGAQPDPTAPPLGGDPTSPWWKRMPDAAFGGSARGRAALEAAVGEAARGAGEVGGNNMGPDVDKYLNDIVEPPNNWCAGFVSWCLRESGSMPIDYTVGARDVLNQARRRGLTTFNDPAAARPLPGDIVVWWRGSPNGWRGHIGFVHHTEHGRVFTIEGNKSSRVEGFDYPVVGMQRLLGFVRL